MNRFLLMSFGLAVFVLAVPHADAADDGLRTAADRPIDIQHIRLELDVSLKKQTVTGTATITFQPNRTAASVSLDAVGLEIARVTRRENGKLESLKFVNSGSKLLVSYPKALERGKPQQLVISYRVRNPKTGLHFFRPTKRDPKLPWMVWSHGEPRSNRYWFPCFDHPNERQTTEVIARVPEGFSVLSNGKLIERKELKKSKQIQFHWKQAKPHVSYLVTLVVGQFEIIRETWRGRPVTYYVMPDRKADAERTFGRTREMLDFSANDLGSNTHGKSTRKLLSSSLRRAEWRTRARPHCTKE